MDTKSYYSAIFFSDFHKRSGDLQEIGFIDELVDYINKRCKNTFVSINDIVVPKVADVIVLIFFAANLEQLNILKCILIISIDNPFRLRSRVSR